MTSSAISRRATRGLWTRIFPKVYWLGVGVPDWRTTVLAAALWAGTGAVVSHSTAAALWGLHGFSIEPIDLTTSRSLKPPGAGGVRVHRARLAAADVTDRDGIPVTTPSRTLIDLASAFPEEVVEAALDDALLRRLTSLPRLRWFVTTQETRGVPGTAAMKRLLAARGPRSPLESPLERKVWHLLTNAGLPEPVPQHAVYDGNAFVARVDLAYPCERVALEVDGYRWHAGRQAWSRDLRRRNRLTALGWRVVHVTQVDLTEGGDAVLREVRELLNCPKPPAQRASRDNFGNDRGKARSNLGRER